jgi:hypothetical protein
MINTTTTVETTFQVLDPIVELPPGTDPLAYAESGLTQLDMGVQTKSVIFATTKIAPYVFVESEIINTMDSPALNLDFELIAESLTGFTIKLNGLPDTNNFYLKWRVQVPPA